jgi:hypothetical protein
MLVLALWLPLTACSDDGGDSDSETPTVASGGLPAATIEGTRFSDPFGYVAEFPAGWRADDNAIDFGDLVTDAFFSPETVDGVQTSLSVTCDRLHGESVSLEQFGAENQNTALELAAIDYRQQESDVRISDLATRHVTYRLERNDITLKKSEYLFVDEQCAWSITLTMPGSADASAEALLDAFISSFELT